MVRCRAGCIPPRTVRYPRVRLVTTIGLMRIYEKPEYAELSGYETGSLLW